MLVTPLPYTLLRNSPAASQERRISAKALRECLPAKLEGMGFRLCSEPSSGCEGTGASSIELLPGVLVSHRFSRARQVWFDFEAKTSGATGNTKQMERNIPAHAWDTFKLSSDDQSERTDPEAT